MEDKWKFHYVHKDLLKAWSDDGVHVNWINPFNGERVDGGRTDRFFWKWTYDLEGCLKEQIKMADEVFGVCLKYFEKGLFNTFFLEKPYLRFSFLFSYLRTPAYRICSMSDKERLEEFDEYFKELSSGNFDFRRKSDVIIRRYSEYLIKAYNIAFTEEITLLDLVPVLLYAPAGRSFVIGGSPVGVINPFYHGRESKDHPQFSFSRNGTVFVLPISPDVTFCLYDPSVYRPRKKNGKCILSKEDVDFLNAVQIFNGEGRNGVVYDCDADYVLSLCSSSFIKCREDFKCSDLDYYPFRNTLSGLGIRTQAEDAYPEYADDSVREYFKSVMNYSDRMGDVNEDDFEEMNHKRYVMAHNLVFEEKI